MAININSEAFCRKAYLNYHCYGNTMGLSSEDMGKITQAWSDRISSWQATVSSDENEYEFDDSDYSNYKSEGKKAAQDATGYEGGGKGKMITRGAVDATLSTAGAFVGIVGTKVLGTVANTALNKVGTKLMGKAAEKALAKTGEEAVKGASKNALEKCGSWSIAAPLALAVAVAYMAKKPNKEQKEACDALQTEMAGAQATLSDTQSEMEYMSEEIIALSDEANMTNEDTNEEIEKQKTEYDMYMASYLAIQEKVDAGEPLTDSEKELYKEVMGYLAEINTLIQDVSEDTTDEVSDLYDEIGTYQDGYDVAAETMGEIEGLTDFAESFDSATRTLCYVEAAAQGLNAASGTQAGIRAGLAAAASMGFNAWAWACAAMGASAAVMSGIGAGQQMAWAGEVGTEIDMRKATQDLNTETMDIYSEEIDAYDGFMQGVEELELEIPDEIAPPEGVGDPNGIESTEYTNYTEILGEMEEGSKVVTENEDGTGKVMLAQQYGTAIAMALGLPDQTQGGKFGQEAIPNILANLIPGQSPENILKVMNGGTLDSSYDASLIQTTTGEDTGKDKNINNSELATKNLRTIINFYKPLLMAASQKGWKC